MRAVTKTSITVDKSTLERFNRLRSEFTPDDYPDPSADEFLNNMMNAWERGDPTTDVGEDVILPSNGPDVDDVLAELEQTRELVEHVPDRTADELEGRFGGHP